MLDCSVCIRRCVRTIFADVLHTHRLPSYPRLKAPAHNLSTFQRGYASEAVPLEDVPTPNPSIDVGIITPYVPRSSRPAKPDEPYSKTSLEQELRWLRDPLKLGDNTVKLLRQDDPQKALAIVRLASKDMECTVSWNHIIDYYMSKGKVADAVKLYNEMKKRAQPPDAHTFTTLFRGFSWHPKFSLSVSRALSIYHSMYADNSPVRPSIIHTNAVLKVCALAGDMDALLGVAARLPPRGHGAPNNLTFTTILNAIRNEAWQSIKGEKDEPAKREKQLRAAMQGRRLWEEIRERWEKGDLYLDEELVCAMGRLLLIANDEKNCDDILSLLEQTMGIPRQVPRQGEPGRRGAIRSLQALDIPKDSDLPSLDEMMPLGSEDTPASEGSPDPESDPFALLPHGRPNSQGAVRPGRNTLSLVLDACTRIRVVRAAQNYWGLLTDPSGSYKILPDTENYHMYLRLLRVQRASKMAVELINDMHQGALGPEVALQIKTFRIGLSCCVRDKQNRNSIAHAAKLIRLMNDTLEYPDARALSMYLDLGLSQQSRDWRTLLVMIRGTELSIRNLRSLITYDPDKGKEHQEDIKNLVKTCISAIDIILDLGNEELTDEERRNCKERKYALQAWITRMANQEKGIRKQGVAGKIYLRGRERRQARAGDDEVGTAHEDVDVDVKEVDSAVSARRGASKERYISRGQRDRKRLADRNVADAWKRFVEE